MLVMSRALVAAAVAAGLLTATAASAADQARLPPGRAAGVSEAALHAPIRLWVAGIGFIVMGIGLAAIGNGDGAATAATTSTHP
jgi:hypothetical protein